MKLLSFTGLISGVTTLLLLHFSANTQATFYVMSVCRRVPKRFNESIFICVGMQFISIGGFELAFGIDLTGFFLGLEFLASMMDASIMLIEPYRLVPAGH